MSKLLKGLSKVINNPYASVVSEGTIYDRGGLIDSGNYMFNAQMSGDLFGGFPSNRIMMLAGEQATGKTFFLLSMIKTFLDANKKGEVFLFETEGAITKTMLEHRGIDVKRVGLCPVHTVDEFKSQTIQLIHEIKQENENENETPRLFALDSIGMLASVKEEADALKGDVKVDMTRAKTLKSAFRILTLHLATLNIPLIATNHTYSETGLFPKKVMGGGSGAYYSASTIAFLSKAQLKDSSNEHVGIKVKIRMEKSRFTKEKSIIGLEIDFKSGVSRYSGLFDWCFAQGILKKEGRTFFWEGQEKKDGLAKTKIDLNPEEFFTEENLKTFVQPRVKQYFTLGSSFVPEENPNLK